MGRRQDQRLANPPTCSQVTGAARGDTSITAHWATPNWPRCHSFDARLKCRLQRCMRRSARSLFRLPPTDSSVCHSSTALSLSPAPPPLPALLASCRHTPGLPSLRSSLPTYSYYYMYTLAPSLSPSPSLSLSFCVSVFLFSPAVCACEESVRAVVLLPLVEYYCISSCRQPGYSPVAGLC